MNEFTAILYIGWLVSIALMAGATWNDNFIDWRLDWLARHKSIWARRDWHIIAYHVFVSWHLVDVGSALNAVAFLVLSALVHAFVFKVFYDSEREKINSFAFTGKPHWIVWRRWQIIPGLIYGAALVGGFNLLVSV